MTNPVVIIDSGPVEIPLEAVVFREDLYPRIEKSPTTVQKYAEDLEVLPPIEVNQRNELIDGWHRWTAHKKQKRGTIRIIVTQTGSDAELLELAIQRNAKHGMQLSTLDKKAMALKIYGMSVYSGQKEREEKKAYLAAILSVDERTIREWTSRTDKEVKAALRLRAFDLWLACHTQQEIADAIGYSRDAVTLFLKTSNFVINGEDSVSHKTSDSEDDTSGLGSLSLTREQLASAAHDINFQTPIYNIWKQQEKTKGSEHFGNSEVRWVDNLLYLYTQPFEVVVDPFGGGGSTIDICRKRLRRYWVGDRKPVVEREGEIRQHDITTGLPRLPWSDVRLVYLDPPYWKQAEGQYSNDPEDLANMTRDDFTKVMVETIRAFAGKLQPGAAIAMIIQPTQWNAPEHTYTDHIVDILRGVMRARKGAEQPPVSLDMRYSVPYESQQYNAQTVEWAKANRRCLVLTREIVVWRVA